MCRLFQRIQLQLKRQQEGDRANFHLDPKQNLRRVQGQVRALMQLDQLQKLVTLWKLLHQLAPRDQRRQGPKLQVTVLLLCVQSFELHRYL